MLGKLNWSITYLPSDIYNYELILFIQYALNKKAAMDDELHRVIDNHRDKLQLNEHSMLLDGAGMDVLAKPKPENG